MIIDFRLRPPVKPYLSGKMYNLERNKRLSESMGMYQPPSVLNYSMDMLLDEMDEAGVTIGVVPGRESNPGMGDATCEEVTSIVPVLSALYSKASSRPYVLNPARFPTPYTAMIAFCTPLLNTARSGIYPS